MSTRPGPTLYSSMFVYLANNRSYRQTAIQFDLQTGKVEKAKRKILKLNVDYCINVEF